MTGQVENRQLIWPTSLVTRADLRRLIAEVEVVDNDLLTGQIHQRTGHGDAQPVSISAMLSDFIEVNSANLQSQPARSDLLIELKRLNSRAPIAHLTFAASVKRDVLSRLASWLREKVHPQSLIEVGLQPNLIGGVHIRTTNQVFDLSIRGRLADGRGAIIEQLEAIGGVQ